MNDYVKSEYIAHHGVQGGLGEVVDKKTGYFNADNDAVLQVG